MSKAKLESESTKTTAKGKAAKSKTTTKSKATTKPKSKKTTALTTPEDSFIELDYSKFGNVGFSTVHETIDISGRTEKDMKKKITALFHFLRNTKVTKNIDNHKTATFFLGEQKLFSIFQKAGDYEANRFSFVSYNLDGTTTKKITNLTAQKEILKAYGFDVSKLKDNDSYLMDENEKENALSKTNDFGDFDSGFDEVD